MITSANLLDAWDVGTSQPAWRRALILAGLMRPNDTEQVLAELPIGARDSLLLNLRERLFGSAFSCLARCPMCNDQLDVSFAACDIRGADSLNSQSVITVQVDGVTVECRLPRTCDVAAVIDTGPTNPDVAYIALLAQCVLSASDANGVAIASVQVLPLAVQDALMARMAQADPQADVQLAMHCPACHHEWLAQFDIASFLWSEVSDWAGRILREVHALASAYGWREADILALSADRRQLYLRLIGG